MKRITDKFSETPRVVLFAIAAAFLARIAFAIVVPPEQTWSDSGGYQTIASNVANGAGFTMDGTTPTRERPPGYPLFLAAIYMVFGTHPWIAIILQALLGSLIVAFAYAVGRRLNGREAGVIAAILVACYPALIYYDTRILREGLTTVLVLVYAWTVTREAFVNDLRWTAVSGLLLGAIAFVRPELATLGLPGLMRLGGANSCGGIIRRTLLLGLPVLLLWGPWMARNYSHFGDPSPVHDSVASAVWFGTRWADIGGEDRKREDHIALKQETWDLNNTNDGEGYAGRVAEDLAQRPGWMVGMVGKKAVLFWKDANGVRKTLPKILPLLATSVNIYYYVLLGFALAGIWTWRNRPVVRTLGFTILSYCLPYALLHVRNRYRVPLMPIVLILSAGGLSLFYAMIRVRLAVRQPSRSPDPQSA